MRGGTGTPCHARVPWVARKKLCLLEKLPLHFWEARNCLPGFPEVSVPLGSCLGGQGRGREGSVLGTCTLSEGRHLSHLPVTVAGQRPPVQSPQPAG